MREPVSDDRTNFFAHMLKCKRCEDGPHANRCEIGLAAWSHEPDPLAIGDTVVDRVFGHVGKVIEIDRADPEFPIRVQYGLSWWCLPGELTKVTP